MSNLGFRSSYTWEDLRPVHPLFVTAIIFQAVGAIVGLVMQAVPGWFESIWIGGAMATFPGYLVGIPVQACLRPGSITRNKSIVLFMGAVALFFFVSAFAFLRAALRAA